MIKEKFESSQEETRINEWKKEIKRGGGTKEQLGNMLEQKPTLEEVRELMKIYEPLLLKNEQKEEIARIIMDQEPNNEDLIWIVEFVNGPIKEKAGRILLNRDPNVRQLWNIIYEMKNEQVRREALMQLKKKENELDEYQKEDLKARLTHYGL